MADWEHETYRRIYRTPDPKWLTLPASTRALAAELLRWVDDDGALYLRAGETPAQAIARVLQAPRSDVAWVKRSTTELVDDKHLIVESDRVSIRNFKVAQGIVDSAEVISQRRSKEAERKAKYRAARRNGPDVPTDNAGHVRDNVPGTEMGHVPRDNGTGSRAPAPPHVREGAPARTLPLSVPFRSVPEEQQQRVRPGDDPLVDRLLASADLQREGLTDDQATRTAAKLRGDAMGLGIREARTLEAIDHALDALSIARLKGDRSGGLGFVVKVVREVSPKGALESRKPEPRDANGDPPKPKLLPAGQFGGYR